MKSGIYYKFLGFQSIDYKAYKPYLEDLALEGYELVGVGIGMRGHFKKIEPNPIKYCIDVVSNEELEEYRELCEDSGWEWVGKIGVANIFKAREGTNPIPIHTDEEREARQIKKVLSRKEGSFMWFGLIWALMGISNVCMLDYRDLTNNLSIMNIFMQLGLAMMYMLKGVYLRWYVHKLDRFIKSKQAIQYSVTMAKVRRNIDFFIVCLIWIALCIGFIGEKAWLWIISVIGVGVVIGSTILIRKCWTLKKGPMVKVFYTLMLTLIFIGAFYGMASTIISVSTSNRKDLLKKEEQIRPLSMTYFPAFKDVIIEESRIDEGSSIFVESYYEYTEYAEEVAWFEVNYYKIRHEIISDYFWKKLLEDNGAGAGEYGSVNKVATMVHDVDEAYYDDNHHELLLKKGKEVVYLQAYDIDVWATENVEVIKGIWSDKQ